MEKENLTQQKHIHQSKEVYYHTTTAVLPPFFRDHPGELVTEENF